jgi:hypothetical protein
MSAAKRATKGTFGIVRVSQSCLLLVIESTIWRRVEHLKPTECIQAGLGLRPSESFPLITKFATRGLAVEVPVDGGFARLRRRFQALDSRRRVFTLDRGFFYAPGIGARRARFRFRPD